MSLQGVRYLLSSLLVLILQNAFMLLIWALRKWKWIHNPYWLHLSQGLFFNQLFATSVVLWNNWSNLSSCSHWMDSAKDNSDYPGISNIHGFWLANYPILLNLYIRKLMTDSLGNVLRFSMLFFSIQKDFLNENRILLNISDVFFKFCYSLVILAYDAHSFSVIWWKYFDCQYFYVVNSFLCKFSA